MRQDASRPGLAAAKVSRPENSGLRALRVLQKATSRGLRALFQHK